MSNHNQDTPSLSDIKKQHQELKELCESLDPYRTWDDKEKKEMKKKLKKFGIETTDDPFKLTNKLLELLVSLETSEAKSSPN